MAHMPCSIIMLNRINNCYMSLKEEDRKIMVSLEYKIKTYIANKED